VKPDNILVRSVTLVRASALRYELGADGGLRVAPGCGGRVLPAGAAAPGVGAFADACAAVAAAHASRPEDPLLMIPHVVLADRDKARPVGRLGAPADPVESGTPQYTAPEVWRRLPAVAAELRRSGASAPLRPQLPAAIDMFAVGITTWCLVSGGFPYYDEGLAGGGGGSGVAAAAARVASDIFFNRNLRTPLPPAAVAASPSLLPFLVGCLHHDPVGARLGVAAALAHPFFDDLSSRISSGAGSGVPVAAAAEAEAEARDAPTTPGVRAPAREAASVGAVPRGRSRSRVCRSRANSCVSIEDGAGMQTRSQRVQASAKARAEKRGAEQRGAEQRGSSPGQLCISMTASDGGCSGGGDSPM
jgi:serine/threonine protein kinase